MDINKLYEEVTGYIEGFDVNSEGDTTHSKYQEVTAIIYRLMEIRNQIAYLELMGQAPPEAKKFRTTILEKTIDDLKVIAQFESRKISARQLEWEMSRR